MHRYSGPGCVVWEITLECNLNCMHCGSAAGKKRSDELTTEEAQDLCRQMKEIGTKGVALMGGEPFLREDWFEIGSYIKELGMELSIITNGYIENDAVFKELSKIEPDQFSVSIDAGSAAIHDRIRGRKGSFQHAIRTIEHVLDIGIPTGVITTVHKRNLQELKAIRDLIAGKEIAWQIQTASPMGRLGKDHVLSYKQYYAVGMFIANTKAEYSKDELMIAGAHDMGYHSHYLPPLQVKSWQGCQAGISTLGIQSNGNILGCLSLGDEFIEGNIRNQRLIDIWNDPTFSTYSRKATASHVAGDCVDCVHKDTCKGGCCAVSQSTSGKLHSNPYCFRRIEEKII